MFAASAAARTPAQLRADAATAVKAFVQADAFAASNKAATRERDAALRPDKGTPVVELGAVRGAYAFSWLTLNKRRCYAIGAPGHGYSSLFGPCLPATVPCAALCLSSLGVRLPVTGKFTFYAGGAVPRTATTVELTLLDGSHVTVKTSAGIVDGRRGLMATLGRSDLRSAVARKGSRVVGRMTRTAADIHHECALLRLRCAP